MPEILSRAQIEEIAKHGASVNEFKSLISTALAYIRAVEKAPHASDCSQYLPKGWRWEVRKRGSRPCDCWKSKIQGGAR